jgi:DME family drug/metabolite transporter
VKGYGLVLIAATLWGSIGIFYSQIIGVYGLSPLAAVLARGIVACGVLIGALSLVRRDLLRVRWRDLPYFAVMGFVTVTLVFVLYAYAIVQVGVSVASVLQYTAPAFVTIIAWQVFHEPLDRVKLGALALCLAGVALIGRLYDATGVQFNVLGTLCGLGSGITFGLYSILNKRALRTYNAWTVTTYNLSFGVLFLALAQAPVVLPTVLAVPGSWLFIVGLAIGPTVAAHGLYTNGLVHVPASNASILATWEPATATLLAYVILGERLDVPQLIGAAAILAGVIALGRKSG